MKLQASPSRATDAHRAAPRLAGRSDTAVVGRPLLLPRGHALDDVLRVREPVRVHELELARVLERGAREDVDQLLDGLPRARRAPLDLGDQARRELAPRA